MHGWHGSIQGKDHQQTLKPQMKLREFIGDAYKTCEDALVMLLYFVTMPSNSCATNCKPLSHTKGILNTTCMLIQSA